MRPIIFLASAAIFLLSCSGISTENGMNPSRELPSPRVESTPRYLEQLSGRGEDENGLPFSFHTYKGPDGQKIVTKFEVYKGTEGAEARFGRIVKSSVKVIEDGALVDQKGLQAGSRAILQIESSDTSQLEFKLLLRDGARLHIVDGESPEYLREFEKEYLASIFQIN